MNPTIKKILIAIMMIILIVILVLIINKVTKKEEPKKEEQKVEEKKQEEQKEEIIDDDDIVLPPDDIVKTISCSYEGDEYNVISEKATVTFHLDEENNVVIQEDVREYKFDKVDIDDYINNKTLAYISAVLDNIKGISSTLTTIDQAEHTYRYSTVYNYKELNLDDLYNFYYKRFYNNGDINMTKEQFDEAYKSLKFPALSNSYIKSGYTCE